jgi:hypothetical protein
MLRRARKRALRYAGTLTVVLSLASWAAAAPPWKHAAEDDFQKAALDQVVVDSLGQVTLAFNLDALAKPDQTPLVWCLAVDPRGRVLAGTGNEGKLYRIDPATRKTEVLFDSDELEILSLAVAPDGTVYAGSGPKGRIFRIASDGAAETYYETGAAYVWALALNPKGELFAATGPEGALFKITARNVGQALYRSPYTHLLSLAIDGAGRLYAGSDREGLIYQIDPAGAVSVLYDTPQREVRSLAVDADGTVYAAATGQGGPEAGRAAPRPAVARPPAGRSPAAGPSPGPPSPGAPSAAAEPAPPPRPPTAPAATAAPADAVYRIAPTGAVTTLFQPPQGAVLALLRTPGPDPRLLVAAADDEGRLYQVDLERRDRTVMLARTRPGQVVALAADHTGAVYLATANPGEVHRLDTQYAASGTLTSEVLDARFTSTWGTLRLRGRSPDGTSVTVACRSGNVSKVDDTWSPWSNEAPAPPDDARPGTAPIPCPPARFLQYRLTLHRGLAAGQAARSETPLIREIIAAYLPANQPPEVLRIQEVGQAARPAAPRPPAPDTPPAKPANPGADSLRLAWQARDPNGDTLRFDLFFRSETDTAWRPLAKDLAAAEYTWNTASVPDGRYRVQVVATDAPSHPPERALAAAAVSDVLLVDQTAPVVKVVPAREAPAAARPATSPATQPAARHRDFDVSAIDDLSDIVSASWSLDGGPWIPCLPADLVFDSPSETFRVTVKDLAPGEHSLVFRAEDAAGQIGAGQTTVVVK